MDTAPYDTLVIGASAAGVSAAIYLARRKVNFLVVSKDVGGEVATSGEIDNYPGVPGTNGLELSDRFGAHLAKYGVKPVLYTEIESIKKQPDGLFCVTVKRAQERMVSDRVNGDGADGSPRCDYLARTVIVATGMSPRPLGVPGDREYRNKGVSYCTVCDGPIFRGKTTATIGGGNSALESALMMASLAKKHYIINKNPAFKGDAVYLENLKKYPNVEIIFNALTEEILGDGKIVTGIRYRDTAANEAKNLPVDGVFVHIGMVPGSTFTPAELTKNAYGEIPVTSKCETNVPGLFAAGDVTDVPYKQISVAVGQGTIAALAAIEYLNKN